MSGKAALIILLALAVCGLAIAVAGRDDPLGAHGALVIVAALAGFLIVGSGYYSPDHLKSGTNITTTIQPKPASSLRWPGPFRTFCRRLVAWLLVYPNDIRRRVVKLWAAPSGSHYSIIFGFGGDALIATSLYVLQRTTRARLPDQSSPWFVLLGYNLFC